MFDKFSDYLYSMLLPALRRGKQMGNQFYRFFQVAGRLFDSMKADLFRLREEIAVMTASEAMLPVHGADRQLHRLMGETPENYRIRLALYASVAEKAGTNEGIRYLARSFGYDTVEIAPSDDPAKWAEATVQFIGGKIVLDDQTLLLSELDRIKPARTVLHLVKEQRYSGTLYVGCGLCIGKQMTLRQG